jgi:cytochrome c
MRHSGPMIAAACAALLAACGKPSSSTSAESGAAATTEAPASQMLMSDADMRKAQASLPAPYNTADLSNGQSRFALCATCHTLTKGGPNMTGPNLYGVFGRKAGSLAGYSYSNDLKAGGWTWDPAHVDTWITNPRATLANTKMTFAGLKDPKDRTDVIAYLMVNTGYKP